jgi:hypothetical protein
VIDTGNVAENSKQMVKGLLQSAGVDEGQVKEAWSRDGNVFSAIDDVQRTSITKQMIAAQQQMQREGLQAVSVQAAVPQPTQMVQTSPVTYEQPARQQIPPDGLSMQVGPRPAAPETRLVPNVDGAKGPLSGVGSKLNRFRRR